jgi:hypothetical protein
MDGLLMEVALAWRLGAGIPVLLSSRARRRLTCEIEPPRSWAPPGTSSSARYRTRLVANAATLESHNKSRFAAWGSRWVRSATSPGRRRVARLSRLGTAPPERPTGNPARDALWAERRVSALTLEIWTVRLSPLSRKRPRSRAVRRRSPRPFPRGVGAHPLSCAGQRGEP